MSTNFLKRFDLFLTILFFALAIPAEKGELFSMLEEQTLSFRQLLRQRYGDPEVMNFVDDVILVNTDEAFFKSYGSYPFRRVDIARIAENLRTLGAHVVALDILMDFPSSYGEDAPTAEILKRAGNILVVSQGEFRNGKFQKINYPTPTIREVTRSGYTNISSFSQVWTTLSRLRVFPEMVSEADGLPFSVQALAMHWLTQPKLQDRKLIFDGRFTVPLDQFNSFYIDFPALPGGARFLSQVKGLSAHEFLHLEDLDKEERAELSYWVKDKIVIVGDTSEVSHDWFDTPVGMVYGVEIIADTIHTLMRGAPLRPASDQVELASALMVMLLLMLTTGVGHPLLRTGLVLLLFGVYMAAVTWFYVRGGMVVSVSYVTIAGFLSFMSINLRFFLQERGQKTLIKDAFGQYLSPKVVEILVKDPTRLRLGGEQREMTALFSDVAGFSTISEKLTPQELVHLLNEYLTAMCDIIARYEGTVDKFEGDAIIAFWGAPLEQPDHAVRACLACIDMQKYLREQRTRWKEAGTPELSTRIGLNSGLMVVGNMGSKQRMDYTIMGDAVNLAARLEGANKFYGSDVMISDATYRLAQEQVEVRELDTIRVVGKKEPVTVYQLLDRKGELTGERLELITGYRQAVGLYKERRFQEAMERMDQLLTRFGEDGPTRTYLNRCRDYVQNPPPEEWDGVFQLTSKG
ncbi:MAG: adenylate/guanylate cyclase domain-containing protein [Magnetococcales bacterium]|nr:adenylate/guanylate cyclase domain-containing protein [Magnetococcales bacterium]